jgi:hypothetical protein
MGGMGGMGGGMGGMGGFGSVPATELPSATLAPGQTRDLATRVVNLNGPPRGSRPAMPAAGEDLELSDVTEITGSEPIAKALRLLAAEKAPGSVAQLVFWRLSGMDWPWITRLSRSWANPEEVGLAHRFVDGLIVRDPSSLDDTGVVYVEVEAASEPSEPLATELRSALKDSRVLGLIARSGVPTHPDGPSVACHVKLLRQGDEPVAMVQMALSDPSGQKWLSPTRFTVPLEPGTKGETVAEAVSVGLLHHLVRVSVRKDLTRDSRGRNVMNFRVRIDNASPLVLHGLTIAGTKEGAVPATLVGVSVSPRRSLVVPASPEAVDRLGLKGGVQAVAADLSGL